MAPITWKNVDIPGFSNNIAATALSQVGSNMDGAFSAIQKIIDEGKAVQDNNWQNKARINTEDEIANIQNLANLAALRGQEDNFDLGSIRERNGAQADAGQITTALTEQLEKLRGLAVNDASAIGRQVADQTGSVSQGAEAFRSALLKAGAQDSYANTQTDQFMKSGLTSLAQAQKEESAQNTIAAMQELSGLNPNKDNMEEKLAGFNVKYGGKLDMTALYDFVGKDAAYTEKRQNYLDEQSVDSAINRATGNIQQSGDRTQALNTILSSNLTSKQKGLASKRFNELYPGNLNDIETAELNAAYGEWDVKHAAINQHFQEAITPYAAAVSNTAFSPGITEAVDDMAKKGGLIKSVKEGTSTGSWLRNLSPNTSFGNEITARLSKFQDILTANGLTQKEADIVTLEALNRSGMHSDSGILRDNVGISTKLFVQKLPGAIFQLLQHKQAVADKTAVENNISHKQLELEQQRTQGKTSELKRIKQQKYGKGTPAEVDRSYKLSGSVIPENLKSVSSFNVDNIEDAVNKLMSNFSKKQTGKKYNPNSLED